MCLCVLAVSNNVSEAKGNWGKPLIHGLLLGSDNSCNVELFVPFALVYCICILKSNSLLPAEFYHDQSKIIKSEYFPVILIGSGKRYPLQGVNCQYNVNKKGFFDVKLQPLM